MLKPAQCVRSSGAVDPSFGFRQRQARRRCKSLEHRSECFLLFLLSQGFSTLAAARRRCVLFAGRVHQSCHCVDSASGLSRSAITGTKIQQVSLKVRIDLARRRFLVSQAEQNSVLGLQRTMILYANPKTHHNSPYCASSLLLSPVPLQREWHSRS
jgi:hypothetical protein